MKSNMSALQWEKTEFSNSINDLTFARRKFFAKMTVITLNRPQIGRNNDQILCHKQKLLKITQISFKKRKMFLMFGLKLGRNLK